MSAPESGHFSEPFEGKDGQWYFNLKSGNNRIVMASEGYETKEHAEEGIDAAKRAFSDASQADG